MGLFSLKSAILLDDLLKIRQTLSEFNGILSSVSMLDDILAYEIEDREDLFNLSLGKSIVINLNNLIISLRLQLRMVLNDLFLGIGITSKSEIYLCNTMILN